MSIPDDDSCPVPDHAALQSWLQEWADLLEQEQISAEELVGHLGATRRAARDLGWLSDWLLLAARQQGASLPDLATAWSLSGSRKNVHGPDQRLKTLADRVGAAEAVRERFLALPVEMSPEYDHERGR